MLKEKFRPGQAKAFDKIIENLAAGKTHTSIVLPTRYGKSDVIRLASMEAKKQKLCYASIVLSPSLYLRDQIVRQDKIHEMIIRYDLLDELSMARNVRTLDCSYSELPVFSNNEYLLSATMQMATVQMNDFSKLVNSIMETTGLPLMIHIDECHETSENKRRGELVSMIVSNGGIVVLHTATAVRADGEMIPGFDEVTLKEEEITRYLVEDYGDGIHNKIEVYEGTRSWVRLKADVEVTFKEAWDEKPCPICRLSRQAVDVNLSDLGGEETSLLSECSPSMARKYLSSACRNPMVIEKAVAMLLSSLGARKRINPESAAIVFTGSDFEKYEDNRHALDIKEEIETQDPSYDVSIVTMKSSEDKKASKGIEDFAAGRGDILIVKQMGGVGLDAPRLKVMLDLSPVRTISSVIQRMMRVATPWAGNKFGEIITMADPIMERIWSKFIVEQGGEADLNAYGHDELDLIKTYLKPKDPRPDIDRLVIESAQLFGYDDSEGVIGDMELYEDAKWHAEKFPELLQTRSLASISQILATKHCPAPVLNGKTSGQIIEKLWKDIFERCKTIAQSKSPYTADNREPHIQVFRSVMNSAKSHVNVDLSVELRQITSIRTLEAMKTFLQSYE